MMTFRMHRENACSGLLLLGALVLAGCNTTQYQSSGKGSGGQIITTGSVQTQAPQKIKPVDFQPLAKRAAVAVVKRSAKLDLGSKPTLYVDMIRNSTPNTQDMDKVTAVLHKELARSGRFQLIPLEKNAAYQQSLDYQQSEGSMNPSIAVQLGRQTGADLMLYGAVTHLKKSNTYQLTTHMMNLKSGELLFTDKQYARK
ncbi:hypothetical protein [Tolumonas lignilytica]|uniref:hypothetical protein n=1 Tax=Tolumonas lignilytica TaxID=1283284 RepID=UPI000467DF76|nr:hypothetical protein [Tolumonas lignilytica]